jgi:DNA-directed RNA polymerase specialized sigma24 family protein
MYAVPMSTPDNQRNRQIEDWLRRARNGSLEALGEALDACRQYLQVVAGSELESDLRPKGGASDLVQETYRDAQRQFDNFRGETAEQFLAWQTAILRGHASNFTRQNPHTALRRPGRAVARDAPGGAAGEAVQAQGGETPCQFAQRHGEEVALEDALVQGQETWLGRGTAARCAPVRVAQGLGGGTQRQWQRGRVLLTTPQVPCESRTYIY